MKENMKRVITLMLVLFMVVGLVPTKTFAENACEIEKNGGLEISQDLGIEPLELKGTEASEEKEYWKKGFETLDWNQIQKAEGFHWPLAKGQKLVKPRSEPIQSVDLNYIGQYIDDDGQEVVRVELRMMYNAVKGIFQKVQLRFDPKLEELVDWNKTGFLTPKQDILKVPSTIDENGARTISLDEIRANTFANQHIYHSPLNIVLKPNAKLSSIGRDSYIQSRFVDSDGIRVLNRAVGDIVADATRYTITAGIPVNDKNKTLFRIGDFKTRGINSEFSWNYFKGASLSTDYSDVKESGLNAKIKTYNGLTIQYDSYPEDVDTVLKGNGYKYGLVFTFDPVLTTILKNEKKGSGDEKIGEIYRYDKDGKLQNNASNKAIEIRRSHLNIDPETERVFIFLRPSSGPTLPTPSGGTYNPITVSDSEWSTKVLPKKYERTLTRVKWLVDIDKMEELVNQPTGKAGGLTYLNLDATAGILVENPQGWADFEASIEKPIVIHEQGFLITELSEPLYTGDGLTQRNNQIQYKLGAGNNYLVDTVQGAYFGNNNINGFRGRIEGISYGGDGGRFFVSNPTMNAAEGNKYIKGGRTIKDKVTVYLPNKANYGGNVTMYGVDPGPGLIQAGILVKANANDPSIIEIYSPFSVNKAKISYLDKENVNHLINSELEVRSGYPNQYRWENANDGALTTDYIHKRSPMKLSVETKKVNFDMDFTVEFSTGSSSNGKLTITRLPSFTKLEKTYSNPTYLFNTNTETPFLIGKADYLPMQDMIFTDTIEFHGYSKFGGARIRLIGENIADQKTFEATTNAGNDSYDDDGNLIPKESAGVDLTYDGETHRAFPYKMNKPDALGDMVKDMPLYFSNNNSSSLQSYSKIERVNAKVTFDLKGGSLPVTEASYNERIRPTEPVERIVPDNKYYIDPSQSASAGQARKALKYQAFDEGLADDKREKLVPALGEDGLQVDYVPNGFVGDNIQFINKDTGKEMTEEEKALRKMPEGLESANQDYKFIGWSTKENTTIEDWATMEEATTLEQVNDTSKAYRFTENSPVDKNITVYALYAKGKTIKLHTNTGSNDKTIEVTLVPNGKGGYEIPVVSGKNGLATKGFSKKNHTFAGWTKTPNEEINTASNVDTQDGRFKEKYTYKLQTEQGDVTIPSTKYDSITVKADDFGDDVTDLYARYSPYITIRATKEWKNADAISGATAQVGLIYRTAVGEYGGEVINEVAATYYPYMGSIIMEKVNESPESPEVEALKKFKKGSNPINEITWEVPGFNELGERLSYLLIEFGGKDKNAVQKFKDFHSNWSDYGIFLHPTGQGDSVAKNQVFNTHVRKVGAGEGTPDEIDTFTGATVRQHNNADNQFTGYTIAVTNKLVDLGNPVLDIIYAGQKHITVKVNAGKEPEKVVTEVKLPNEKTVYVKYISPSEYQVFNDKAGQTPASDLSIEAVGEEGDSFKLSYTDETKFKIGQEVSVQNFKGDAESEVVTRTVLGQLTSNAPGKPIQKPRDDASDKIKLEVSIPKDHVKGPNPVFTLINHLGKTIENEDVIIEGTYDSENNLVSFEVPESILIHGQVLKAVLTESDKKPGESIDSDPIDIEGPRVWDVSYKMENQRYIVNAKVDVDDLKNRDSVFVRIGGTDYPAQVDDQGIITAFLPPLTADGSELKVVAKDRLNNEGLGTGDDISTKMASFINNVREPKAGAWSVFVQGKEQANADYITTVEVQRQGQVIFTDTKIINHTNTVRFILKDVRGILRLEKGDIVTITPSKGQPYEGKAIIFVIQ